MKDTFKFKLLITNCEFVGLKFFINQKRDKKYSNYLLSLMRLNYNHFQVYRIIK